MKKFEKYKILFISLLLICTLLIAFTPQIQKESETKRLTESEIEILRENYPIFTGSPPQINSNRAYTPIEEMKEMCETFVYCEVVDDYYYGVVNLATGDVEFDVKLESHGLDKMNHCYFTVKVLSDVEKLIPDGFEFTYSFSEIYFDYIPYPKPGDRYVIPLYINGKDDLKFETAHKTMFYVTTDGYVLATYNSDAESFTGIKVNELMEKLKKTPEQKEKYLEFRRSEYESTNGSRGFESIEMLKEKLANKDK